MEIAVVVNQEEQFLDCILNYEILSICDKTRFCMIRTKKGYFYNEFIANGFVALAWNLITSHTSFAEGSIDTLKDNVLIKYAEIKRPTTVINKCKSFINDVNVGDYIVIPSAGSEDITIALAGDYYEEEIKTYEVEREVIARIEKNDVQINDISCPYRKRRKITPLLTLKSSEVDGKLFKAISNYHGISNFDDYWRDILGLLYSAYSYRNNLNIVYHIKRTDPVGPRKLSQLLWAATDCWCFLIDESKISAQVSVASPGPVDFSIADSLPAIIDGAKLIAGFTIGAISVVKPDAIPGLIKNLFSLPAEVSKEYIAAKRELIQSQKEAQMLPLEIEEKELDNLSKKLEILERLTTLGIDPKRIEGSALALANTFDYLNIENPESHLSISSAESQYQIDELLEEEAIEEETT